MPNVCGLLLDGDSGKTCSVLAIVGLLEARKKGKGGRERKREEKNETLHQGTRNANAYLLHRNRCQTVRNTRPKTPRSPRENEGTEGIEFLFLLAALVMERRVVDTKKTGGAHSDRQGYRN